MRSLNPLEYHQISKSKSIKLLLFVISVVFIFWFLIYPRTYPYQESKAHSDVIYGPEGSINTVLLDQFIQKYKNSESSELRVALYSKEGSPSIFDLKYEKSGFVCIYDNTRNVYGREMFPTKILLKEVYKINTGKSTEYYMETVEGKKILIHWVE